MTFWAIADPTGNVLKVLGQETHWWRLGRMPAFIALDPGGRIAYRHWGRSMRDWPNFDEAAQMIARRPQNI